MQEQGEKVVSGLKEIHGEFAQLSELGEMERDYAQKLVDSLRLLQSVIDNVIPIAKEALGDRFAYVQEAFLASDAVLLMRDSNGELFSMPLSRLDSSEILSIVQEVTPSLKKLISDKRRETGERVEILERILKELKKVSAPIKGREAKDSKEIEEDIVSASLASE